MSDPFSKYSNSDKRDRHLIISHPYGGVRQLAIGTYTRLCAFCGGKVIRTKDISYSCFSCGRQYDDIADIIDSLIIENEEITTSEIAETLKVEEQLIITYLDQNHMHLNSGGGARACVYCGREIEKGNWCGQCDAKVSSSSSSKNCLSHGRRPSSTIPTSQNAPSMQKCIFWEKENNAKNPVLFIRRHGTFLTA